MKTESSKIKIHPPHGFSQAAHIKNLQTLEAFSHTAQVQPEAFWGELSKALIFEKKYDKILEWNCPKAKWFVGAQINVSRNCLDRHAKSTPHKTAIIWEGEPHDGKTAIEISRVSYLDLLEKTCQIANTLKDLGVKVGDRVAIYMPAVVETVASMQACARIGAIHTVIFGGFSAQAIADRIRDCTAKVIITADGTYRKGKWLGLKKVVDEALLKPGTESIEKVLVFERDKNQSHTTNPKTNSDRDLLWSETVLKARTHCEIVPLDSEHPLFILYTSGTTGKPKGLFHTQAGYLLWAHWTTRWLFDFKDQDIFWCTADCGWITGHTYLAYGPLSLGGTIVMYEGNPLIPHPGRFWDIIDRHHVTTLYTSPTAVRTFMRLGDEWPKKYHLKSLRLLGSVGEPINPEAWLWYHKNIGQGQCPIVDTYWQTETGGAVIAPLPGANILKPGSANQPLPGIEAQIVNPETGDPLQTNQKGVLVIQKPWPSMARGIWGDPGRFEKTYWNTQPQLKNTYVTSDFAEKDEDGDIWIDGRMDDVMNVSGHRIGSAEIESASVESVFVSEAGAVGVNDPIKGQSITVFITLKSSTNELLKEGKITHQKIIEDIHQHIIQDIGSLARPDRIEFKESLPKTRSGKIMRRLLRELAETGEIKGDTTTLDD